MTDQKQVVFERLLAICNAYGYQPKGRIEEFRSVFEQVLKECAAAIKKPYTHEAGPLHAGHYEASRVFSGMPPKKAYKALRGYSPGMKIRDAEDAILSATVWSFGHGLIEAAKESLPTECKMLAIRYQKATSGERDEILERVINQLLFTRWSEKHPILYRADREMRNDDNGAHVDYSYSPWMVLPHVFGRFPDSTTRPNCMGMSILMSAWCRLAGLNYLHCRLIHDNVNYHWAQYAQLVQRVLFFCDVNNIVLPSQIRWELESNLKQFERMQLDTTPSSVSDAHAFVCAEINPGEWAVLDPWMARLYSVDSNPDADVEVDDERFHLTAEAAWDVFQDQVAVMPGLTMTSTDRTWDDFYVSLGDSLDRQIEIARTIHAVVQEWAAQDFSQSPQSLQQSAYLIADALEARGVRLPESFCDLAFELMAEDTSLGDKERTTAAIVHGLIGQLTQFLYAVHEGVKSVTADIAVSDFDSWIDRFERDYRRVETVARRAWQDWVVAGLLFVVSAARDILDLATGEPKNANEPYITIEYGIAPVQVGLGALTHLMAWDDMVAAKADILDILPLTSSQLIWHEAVTAIHKKYTDYLLCCEVMCSQEELAAYKHANPASNLGDFKPKKRSEHLPTFGELLLSDRQDWPSLLESSGVDWLSEDQCELLRTSTQAMRRLEPFQQHRLVRRLLARLEGENHPSAIPL